ncbi:carbohydate-binding domain-containing protein [Photobacterium japonica]|uniref:family 20 glycosylhydrolase n=1 Tax=Photobacterium japonica TaxID=2910235 RepID=UPI003D104EBE
MKWKTTALALAVGALCSSSVFALPQQALNQFGNDVDLTYTVMDNTQDEWRTFRAKISLNNQGATALPATGWSIWFSHIREVPTVFSDQFTITHVNGDIFKLEPTAAFAGLPAGQALDVEFDGANWQVAKSDVMPNWYFVSEHEGLAVSALIKSTSNSIDGKVPVLPEAELPFVADFADAKQWKRYDAPSLTDAYDPFTAEQRFERNASLSKIEDVVGVVPAPTQMTVGEGAVALDADWVIVYDAGYEEEAAYLGEQLGLTVAPWSPTSAKVIKVGWGQVSLNSRSVWADAYKLTVDAAQGNIKIAAVDAAGAFYAVQSLLQLVDNGNVPAVQITDAPRFEYRGFSLDASRNFRDRETVLRLLDQMARFKLNKLHLRLADDEGWRIEMASLPELTEVGSRRCHDPEERTCLLPFLGAGPDGTADSDGFYTAQEYREILTYAAERNIEVIPELDMPGHAHAAVKAMEARYHRLMDAGKQAEAEEFLLTDFEDKSDYLSVQLFTDNAMNVCMESTFSFVDQVVGELAALHQGVQPLKTFHFGGDEVAGAWKNSPACDAFFANNDKGITSPDQLSQYFVERVAAITANHGLNLGGWEDGLMHNGKVYPRANMANAAVTGNAWQNIWEWGVADRAYNMANNGFKVIYNHATHFYFDHPYEPDPNERGYYWAPRYTDTRKTFSYMPDDVFANADFTRAGAPITKEEVVASAGVKKLERPENVAGLQSSLWAETVRTSEQFEGMVFPRIIAMAERAWHTAAWEANDAQAKPADDAARDADYNRFANLLGQHVFADLEVEGIDFNLPVPGAKVVDGVLHANSAFPGLAIEYSQDNGTSWQVFDAANPPAVAGNVLLRTASGERASRTTSVQ